MERDNLNRVRPIDRPALLYGKMANDLRVIHRAAVCRRPTEYRLWSSTDRTPSATDSDRNVSAARASTTVLVVVINEIA